MMSIVNAKIGDAQIIADIISLSNKDIAKMFGITQNNNPKHPSFYNEEWVLSDFERGEEYFLYMLEGEYVGCVAFEKTNDQTGYLNRLSVLPSYREQESVKHLQNIFSNMGSLKVCRKLVLELLQNTQS